MAPYKVPKLIHLVDAIPLTAIGKIDKKMLRDEANSWTNLSATELSSLPVPAVGMTAQKTESVGARYAELMADQAPPEILDKEDIAYFVLDPDSLTDQVVYAINQPWGVSIADVTVSASGEGLIL